ncbi:MAG TPA: MGMT family protein [Thermoplasmata archaeon]|nr:MGMT family protein [Thermoplasmata archaeon]
MSTLSLLREVIARVPRGKVITYGQVAAAAGFPGGARLTVRALQGESGVPWHRVVGAGGRIALPGEEGREQRLRLEVEGVTFRGGRVRMELHNWTPRVRRKRRRSRDVMVRPAASRSRGIAIPFESRSSFVGPGRPDRSRDREAE